MSDKIMTDDQLEYAKYLHNTDLDNPKLECLALNRFRLRFPTEVLENSYGYIFFTRPELNLLNSDGSPLSQTKNIVEFYDLLQSDLTLFKSLQSNITIKENNYSPLNFIAPLCNNARNFNTKDEIIKTRESAQTANDWRIIYGHRINDSRAADTVDITFSDNRNLSVYKLMKIWVNYINIITTSNRLKPRDYNRKNRILDYASSIYYFLTSEDGESIIYYCKLIGTFPTNIPSSTFSWDFGSHKAPEYSITFQYSMKDESPLVLKDFNKITSEPKSYLGVRNYENYYHESTWCKGARVVSDGAGKGTYKLKFFVE